MRLLIRTAAIPVYLLLALAIYELQAHVRAQTSSGQDAVTTPAKGSAANDLKAAMTSGPENATVSLGNYPNKAINVGGNAVVMPDAAPVDTTGMSVSTNTSFKGVLSANPSTGAVTITNAHTAGTYTVKVTAFGPGGPVTKQFDLTVNSVPTCSSLTFRSAAHFAVSGYPTGVAVGDFNNDGKQDVVTANLFGGNVSVLIGNGDGTFAAAVHYPLSSSGNSVAVGDLDLDGKQDLVAVGGQVDILFGNGDGTFAPKVALTNNLNNGRAVAIADVNSDDKPDIAAAGGQGITLLIGNGNGTFAPAQLMPVGLNQTDLTFGDFNEDGEVDIALTGPVKILLGNGDGTFAAPIENASGGNTVEVGDFDNDGTQDLVTGTQNSASIFMGNGDGTFAPAISYPAGGSYAAAIVGDFDSNGDQDVATSNAFGPSVSVLRGSGNGMFASPVSFAVGSQPESLTAGDLNADGLQDIVSSNSGSNSVSVLLRGCADISVEGPTGTVLSDGSSAVDLGSETVTSSGTPRIFTIRNPGLASLSVGEITVDGTNAADFSINTTATAVSVEGGGSTTFSVTFTPSGPGSRSASLHVLNGDSDESPFDISLTGTGVTSPFPAPTLGNYSDTVVTSSQSTVITPIAPPANSTSLSVETVSDFKGMISVNQTTGAVTVSNAYPVGAFPVTVRAIGDGGTVVRTFLLTVQSTPVCGGTAFGLPTEFPGGHYSQGITGADINNDGKSDLMLVGAFTNNLSVLIGTGNGNFASPVEYAIGNGGRFVTTGDLNNDGKRDVVALFNSGVYVLLGNGNGSLAPAVHYNAGAVPWTGTVADFNGDGNNDIVTGHQDSTDLHILIGNGDGTFAPSVAFSTGVSHRSIASGDFNSDGTQDIASGGGNAMYVLLGNGNGTFADRVVYNAGTQVRGLALGDINNDGIIDAAVANHSSDNVSIFTGNGNGTFATAANFPAGDQPAAIQIADLNGDGRDDVIAGSDSSSGVLVLTANGSGGLNATAQLVSTPTLSLWVGDLDGNGWVDIAAGKPGTSVSVFIRSCADITLEYPTGNALTDGVSIANLGSEINGVSGAAKTFTIRNDGIGPLVLGGITIDGLNPGDFTLNTAGMPNSLPTSGSTSFTVTFRPNGEGPRVAALHIVSGDLDEAPFDINLTGSGNVNPAQTMGIYADASVGLSGNTTISPSAVPVGVTSMSVVAGGGFTGTVTATSSTGVVTVTNAGPTDGTYPITVTGFGALGTVSRTIQLTVTAVPAPCSALTYRSSLVAMSGSGVVNDIAIGDFNKDGHQDLATARTGNIHVMLGNGQGGFGPPVVQGTSGVYTSIVVSDVNGDGNLDLVTTLSNLATLNIRVFKGNGDGTFMSPVSVDIAQSFAVAVADMNTDGKPDIIVRTNDTSLKLLQGVGDGTFFPPVHIGFGTGDSIGKPVPADFDRDGILDLAVLGANNTVRIRKGNGNGTFADSFSSYTVESGPVSLVAADFNADGKPDLVSAHPSPKKVSVLIGVGDGTFAPAVNFVVPIQPTYLAIGDLNSDGKQDIAASGASSSGQRSIAVLNGRGDGTFVNGANLGGGFGPLVVGDFNDDGYQDLVSSLPFGSSLAVMIKGCPRVAFDFDNNGRSDVSVRRPSNNLWYFREDAGWYTTRQWGQAGDKLTPADYDGDGKDDIAIWRPGTGQWYIINSTNQTIEVYNWGVAGDIPMPFDNSRDGKADLIVYRPLNNTWYTRIISATTFQSFTRVYGSAGEKPIIGDFDHDLVTDMALFRPSDGRWHVQKSSGGTNEFPWGISGDIPVPADYDGDGATDLAVFRPSNSRWYIIGSSVGWIQQVWGQAGDIPAPADYDGDGKTDLAIFRPSTGRWHIIRSTQGWATLSFGQDGDVPIPSSYLHMN